jgi:large subunit ribosomal protein L6
MSRIGIKPISIPEGVTVGLKDGLITVKGKNSELTYTFHPNIKVEIQDKSIVVSRKNDNKLNRSLHGLTRSLIFNMVEGVTNGFKKVLEVNGVGYRAQKQGKELVLNLGYSHQVKIPEVEGITLSVEGNNKVIVSGADKQKVGQVAAEIREKRPPEPYKGKGIKYENEHIRRKEGKAGKGKK